MLHRQIAITLALSAIAMSRPSSAQDVTTVPTSASRHVTVIKMPTYGPPPVMLGVQSSPDMLELIGNPSVQKELEIVDHQLDPIYALLAEQSEEIVLSMQGLRDGTISGEQYTARLIQNKATSIGVLNSVLLPHQIGRLKEIVTQTEIERFGEAEALSNGNLAETLGLTDAQKTELKERSKEIEKKLIEDIAKLKQRAKDELLTVLTEKQRRELERLAGKKFKPNPQDYLDAIPVQHR